MSKRINIALCLSGGGFRAALFHLGVLKRLHELGLLGHVRMLSAVSGGAVTATLFHRHLLSPASFDKISPDNRDNFLDQNKKGSPTLTYDWQSFEAQLLKATSNGILGPYLKSFAIWISSALALIAFILYSLAANSAFLWNFPQLIIKSALLVAVILYFSLLPQAMGYVRQRESHSKVIKESDQHAESFYTSRLPSIFRAFVLPFSPGMMRITTLDTLFDRETCGDLHKKLLLCLGTVELTRGREMVFSNHVLTELGQRGSRDLWEGRSYQDDESRSGMPSFTFNIEWLPIAEAVAASSAFPPFFPPVVIRRSTSTRRLVGVFSDGGVIDNAALNAPIDMMIFCSQNWIRYSKQVNYRNGKVIHPSSFEEEISDIFVIDAGAPASRALGRRRWSTIRLLRRIVDIMQVNQDINTIQKLWLMDSKISPKYTAIKIDESEFPWEDGSCSTQIPYYLARIRTHFDAFDPIETAALVYSGYCQANLAFGEKAPARKPLRSFREVSQEVTGTEKVGKMPHNEIVCHLNYSDLRWNGIRKIRRVVAKIKKRLRSTLGKEAYNK